MNLRLIGAALAISVLPAAVQAQTTVDMDRVTCAQYLAMSPAMSGHFSAWISGWAAYQMRRTYVDLVAHQKNIASMKSWCQLRPQASVMEAVKGVIGPQ